jgi:diguanylate cyclase (GGDEF)-like protein/PAS domain S-box-containing protein
MRLMAIQCVGRTESERSRNVESHEQAAVSRDHPRFSQAAARAGVSSGASDHEGTLARGPWDAPIKPSRADGRAAGLRNATGELPTPDEPVSTIAGQGPPQPLPDAIEAPPFALGDHLPCVTFRLRSLGNDRPPAFLYISAQSRELLGVEPDAVVLDANALFEKIPDEDAERLQDRIQHAFATLGQWRHEFRFRLADTVRWLECRARVHRLSADTLCADGYLADITERMAAEDRMRLWMSVVEQTTEGILICDPQQRILAVNPAFERLTGYSQQEAVGKTPRILHSGRQDATFYANLWNTIAATGRWSGEICNRRKNGELYVEWLALDAVYDSRGHVTHYVGVFSDITVRKEVEERIRHLAQHDALTDLPNRSVLMLRLEQLIELADRSKDRIAVLFLDLDGFKHVNDSLGHETGDLLLQTVARRIRSAVRHSDTVARIGGDEFVILLSGLHHPDEAAGVAGELLAAIGRPLMFKDQELRVSASIGIGMFPDDGTRASDLIRNADTAMYRAKNNGRNRYEFCARELNGDAV